MNDLVPELGHPCWEISIFDEHNAESVVNKVPSKLASYIPKVDSSLLELSEVELRKRLKPDALLNKVRISFWEEYSQACWDKRKMRTASIANGNCTTNTLVNTIFEDPRKLAWVLCPVSTYSSTMVETLDTAMAKAREMIEELTFKNNDGKFDIQQARLIMRIIDMLSNRVMGSVPQRIQSVNMTGKLPPQAPSNSVPNMDEKAAARELRSLQQKINARKSMAIPSEVRHVQKDNKQYSTTIPDVEPDPGGYQQSSLLGGESGSNGEGVPEDF